MSIEAKIAAIHDEDLVAELEAARGGFLFAVIVEHIAHRQACATPSGRRPAESRMPAPPWGATSAGATRCGW